MKRTLRLLVPIFLVALILALGSCGGDGDKLLPGSLTVKCPEGEPGIWDCSMTWNQSDWH